MYKELDQHIYSILKNHGKNSKEIFKELKIQTTSCYKELDKHIKSILDKNH